MLLNYPLLLRSICLSLFLSSLAFSQTNGNKTADTTGERTENIQEVVVKSQVKKFKNKKENPAYAIMQEVFKRKRNNALSKYPAYQFDEYEKIEFDINNIDSTFTEKRIFRNLDFIFDYADSTANGKLQLPIFFTEAVYKNYGIGSPEKKNKRILVAQKTSGFKDNQLLTMAAKNLYRDINIYDNTLNYFDIGFQSPAGSDGFSVYDYELSDTLRIRGNEVFRIQYQPKRKDILGFQGYLYITTDTFSVLEATLKSTRKINVNYVNGISTELTYDNPDEDTFLPSKIATELNMSLFSKNKSAKGIIAKRSVFYNNYTFDQPFDSSIFEKKDEIPDENLLSKNEEYWDSVRTDSLTSSEKGIYEMLDKLEDTPKFNRMVQLTEAITSGYWNVGNSIDIGNLYSIYGYNEVEGSRVRLGARTYFSRDDDWRIQGYGAYGFKDRQFKYGLEAKYMFSKVSRFTLGFGSRRDIMQLGSQLTTDDGIMSRSFASSTVFARGENASLSSVTQNNIFAAVEPWKNIQIRLDGSLQSIRSADSNAFSLDYYHNGQLRKTVNDSHLTLSLIARPGAKFTQTGVDRSEVSTLAATIILKYSRGIEGLFNADFSYNKLQLLLYKPFLLGTWGRTVVHFEAGTNFDTVPLALQNIIPGNQSYGLVPNTFSQLNYYEFVADRYTTLHLEHHFNGKILSYLPLIRKLKFREVAFFRAAYGTLSEASKNINAEGWRYTAPHEHIYYEYGCGLENIGFGNLRIFRVDFNWRGNYLHLPDVSKFGVKAGFQFYF